MPPKDWQIGPRNRWAYQHVDEFLPTVPVRHGTVRELPEARPADTTLPYLDGLAILEGGTLLERYENEMTPATRHLSQSVAKSVLGVLAGILGLDVDMPVTELVPEVGESGFAGATIGHLLDMRTATAFVEDYAHFERYDAACGWHDPIAGAPCTVLEFLAQIGPGERPHGEVFVYSSPNTDLLGIAAERAGGAPLAELISTRLWNAVGAEHDALLTVDPAGTAVISGGLNATLRDYLRFGLYVLEAWPDGLGANGYAKQWWRLRDGVIAAQGIHGQFIGIDRAAQRVVTVLSSWPVATDDPLRDQQFALIGGGETI